MTDLPEAKRRAADFVVYLVDPELAFDTGWPIMDPEPYTDREGRTFTPGDKVSDGHGFTLVYEGERDGRALAHHVSDMAPCWRRFSELSIDDPGYAQRAFRLAGDP